MLFKFLGGPPSYPLRYVEAESYEAARRKFLELILTIPEDSRPKANDFFSNELTEKDIIPKDNAIYDPFYVALGKCIPIQTIKA